MLIEPRHLTSFSYVFDLSVTKTALFQITNKLENVYLPFFGDKNGGSTKHLMKTSL